MTSGKSEKRMYRELMLKLQAGQVALIASIAMILMAKPLSDGEYWIGVALLAGIAILGGAVMAIVQFRGVPNE